VTRPRLAVVFSQRAARQIELGLRPRASQMIEVVVHDWLGSRSHARGRLEKADGRAIQAQPFLPGLRLDGFRHSGRDITDCDGLHGRASRCWQR
jgi:hypothetical protein